MSKIFSVERSLRKEHNPNMVKKFYKLINKNPDNEENLALLYKFKDDNKLGDVLLARIYNYRGEDTPDGFVANFFNNFLKRAYYLNPSK